MAMEREGKWPGVAQGSVRNWPEGLDLLFSCESRVRRGRQVGWLRVQGRLVWMSGAI
jgi:hypothetical protein